MDWSEWLGIFSPQISHQEFRPPNSGRQRVLPRRRRLRRRRQAATLQHAKHVQADLEEHVRSPRTVIKYKNNSTSMNHDDLFNQEDSFPNSFKKRILSEKQMPILFLQDNINFSYMLPSAFLKWREYFL